MPKPSGLLMRQQNENKVYTQATKETYIQFMCDIYSMVLNDPKVMGKGVFGKARLLRISKAVDDLYGKYHGAIEGAKNDESDALRVMMDERLERIYGDLFTPFEKRYDWVQPVRSYEPRRIKEPKPTKKAKRRR